MTASIEAEIAALRAVVEDLAHVVKGTRLSRVDVCARIGVETHTLTRWIRQKRFPDQVGGYWLLRDVVEWERAKASVPSPRPTR
jgi:transposase-like protein